MKKLAFLITLLWAVPLWATDYTVCTAGAPTCDYSTIQAALDAQGAAGDRIVIQADTPGTEQVFYETITVDSDNNGESGNHFIVTSRSGDTVVINGGVLATSWTGPDGNGEYYHTGISSNCALVLVDGEEPTKGTEASLNAGEWDYNGGTNRVYYKPSSGVPGDYTIEFSQDSNATVTFNTVSYVTFQNLIIELGGLTTGRVALVDTGADSTDITFENVTFRNAFNELVKATGTENVTINNCTGSHANGGFHGGGADNFTVTNSTIHSIGLRDWRSQQTTVDNEGVTCGSGADYCYVADNEIYNICSVSADRNCTCIYSYNADNVTIKDNICRDFSRMGIYHTDGTSAAGLNATIENNLIIHTSGTSTDTPASEAIGGMWGGLVINQAHDNGLDGTVMQNNTIYYQSDAAHTVDEAKHGALIIFTNHESLADEPVTIRNNLAVGNSYANALQYGSDRDGQTWFGYTINYNLYWITSGTVLISYENDYDDDSAAKATTDWTIAQWSNYQAALSQFDADSPDPADPLFVDATNRNFRVTALSTARNAGTAVAGKIACGGSLDIGAFEMAMSGLPFMPMMILTDCSGNSFSGTIASYTYTAPVSESVLELIGGGNFELIGGGNLDLLE